MNIENGVTTGMYKSDTIGGVQPEAGDGPGPFLMGTKTLISNEVVDREAGALGKITEIMLDVLSGRVAYAVLSFGGFLGLGEKLFAVPWSALVLDTMNKRFMLDVEKERLDGAPGFDKDHWPNMANLEWAADIHAYYGRAMYSA